MALSKYKILKKNKVLKERKIHKKYRNKYTICNGKWKRKKCLLMNFMFILWLCCYSMHIFRLKHFSIVFRKMILELSSLKQICNCPYMPLCWKIEVYLSPGSCPTVQSLGSCLKVRSLESVGSCLRVRGSGPFLRVYELGSHLRVQDLGSFPKVLDSQWESLISFRLTLSLFCRMDLTNFPFDSQRCKFSIESCKILCINFVCCWNYFYVKHGCYYFS